MTKVVDAQHLRHTKDYGFILVITYVTVHERMHSIKHEKIKVSGFVPVKVDIMADQSAVTMEYNAKRDSACCMVPCV